MKNTQIQESLNKVWQEPGPLDIATFKRVAAALIDVCDPQSARDRALLAYLREVNLQSKESRSILDEQQKSKK